MFFQVPQCLDDTEDETLIPDLSFKRKNPPSTGWLIVIHGAVHLLHFSWDLTSSSTALVNSLDHTALMGFNPLFPVVLFPFGNVFLHNSFGLRLCSDFVTWVWVCLIASPDVAAWLLECAWACLSIALKSSVLEFNRCIRFSCYFSMFFQVPQCLDDTKDETLVLASSFKGKNTPGTGDLTPMAHSWKDSAARALDFS